MRRSSQRLGFLFLRARRIKRAANALPDISSPSRTIGEARPRWLLLLSWLPPIICGDDGHFPAGFRIGVHLDIMAFFGEAVSDHFRQFSGGYLCFLHDLVPLFTEYCRAGWRFWRTPFSSAPGVPIRRSKFMPCDPKAAVACR